MSYPNDAFSPTENEIYLIAMLETIKADVEAAFAEAGLALTSSALEAYLRRILQTIGPANLISSMVISKRAAPSQARWDRLLERWPLIVGRPHEEPIPRDGLVDVLSSSLRSLSQQERTQQERTIREMVESRLDDRDFTKEALESCPPNLKEDISEACFSNTSVLVQFSRGSTTLERGSSFPVLMVPPHIPPSFTYHLFRATLDHPEVSIFALQVLGRRVQKSFGVHGRWPTDTVVLGVLRWHIDNRSHIPMSALVDRPFDASLFEECLAFPGCFREGGVKDFNSFMNQTARNLAALKEMARVLRYRTEGRIQSIRESQADSEDVAPPYCAAELASKMWEFCFLPS